MLRLSGSEGDRMKRLALAAVLGWLAAAASADAQNPITIPSSGAASPYPSVIDIQGFPRIVGDEHYNTAQDVKRILQRYKDLQDIIAILGVDELSEEDKLTVARARKVHLDAADRASTRSSRPSLPGRIAPGRRIGRASSWCRRAAPSAPSRR